MLKATKPNQKNWEIILKRPTLPEDHRVRESEVRYLVLTEWYTDDLANHLRGYVQFQQKKRSTGVLKYFASLGILEALPPGQFIQKEFSDKYLKNPHHKEWGHRKLHPRTVRSIEARATLENIIRDHQKRTDIGIMLRKHPLNARDVVGPLTRLRHTKRTHRPNVLYLYGPTGIGKTVNMQRAVKLSGLDHYDKPPKMKWWHRYDQQPVVIMEEFSSCIALETFLKICDGTPMMVESKGSLIEFNSPYIIMTSNRAPEDQYLKEKYVKDKYGMATDLQSEQWLAYYRRITEHTINPVLPVYEKANDPESKQLKQGYDRWEWEDYAEVRAILHQRIFEEVVHFLSSPIREFIPPEEEHSPETTAAIAHMRANAEKVKQLCQNKPLQIELCDEDLALCDDLEDDLTSDEESDSN